MIELRKDYILDRWVILAPGRRKKPNYLSRPLEKSSGKVCVFCRKNEVHTPNEFGRVLDDDGDWKIRWFPNLYPFVEEKGNKKLRTKDTYYTSAAAYGMHEIIVETPNHKKQLWDLPNGEAEKLLDIYNKRIVANEKKGSKYVSIIKNHGHDAGASVAHSHSQVVPLNILPPSIINEAEAISKHKRKRKGCPYCNVIEKEAKSHRKCFENKQAIAFAPYASRFNYEVWIFPKRHFKRLSDATQQEIEGISDLLLSTLKKLKKLDAHYNYGLHYLPSKQPGDFHFHIEIEPRISKWAGFEMNTDIIINSVTPEEASKFYRSR
jgi:UDPglucose--hexose-1-phosphate uridylyltransferase